MIQRKRTAQLFLSVLFFVGVDWISKIVALYYLDDELLCNYGVALSMPVPQGVIIIASGAILLGLFLWYLRLHRHGLVSIWYDIAFVFLFSGGVGNLLDRIVFGCVRDFLPFFGLWVFNVADALVMAGVVILVVLMSSKRSLV